ncbi:hypothetical protein AZI85_07190 [Bdellovibrio bacteriovorus]|uniref:Uncharacterized protein n=1 Tax=Bdellovibrio bacteriovorus TaxID=959 RepID=A0A150WGI1_BDEBC|nr:hypothetical protein [Bdellovibrio bacteriovorus]KYG61985.1 hypothetical protein AZI85_07190 [Bdellovibrio bacteriovorus]
MMNPKYPDKSVEMYIQQFARDFGFNILEVKYTPVWQQEAALRSYNNDEWTWKLARPGSDIRMEIYINYPAYHCSVSFDNTNPSLRSHVPKYFFFEMYLDKVLQAKWEVAQLRKITEEKSWQKNWRTEVEFVKEHLKGHLNEVVEGRDWPEIYFSWDDFVLPEDADKIYEDQVAVIEKGMKKKGQSWLYLFNPFKK